MRKVLLACLILSSLVIAVLLPTADAQGQNQSAAIHKHADNIPGSYIVVFKDEVSARSVETRAADLSQRYGGRLISLYRHALRGFSVRMSEQAAEALARHPLVAYVEEDTVLELAATQQGAPWGLDRIDQRRQPPSNTYTYANNGAGTRVYLIDSGIRTTHEEFEGRASVAFDNVGDGRNGQDCFGHGTQLAGIVGGKTYGVAKGAQLLAVRAFGCTNQSTATKIIEAIEWVMNNHQKPAVAVMSASGGANLALDTAVHNSIGAGVTYVLAAGNINADAGTRSPSRVPEALTVGATDINDARATFSNYGAALDLFAPGVDIPTASIFDDTTTILKSGTSMAAAYVAGTAARYLSGRPGADPSQVSRALVGNATPDKVVNPGDGSPNKLLYTLFNSEHDNRADLDGDYRTDVSVFNRETGEWRSRNSSNDQAVSFYFGQSGDIPTPGDYNGDGKTDYAVFRPANGTWYIATDTSGSFYGVQFGYGTDRPIPRDYDGDGKTDIAVFRPSDTVWYILNSRDNSMSSVQFGLSDDRLVPGDYDGDARADIAVFRPSDGTWYIRRPDGTFHGVVFGVASDWPVQADYDGDGLTDIAVFRPGVGEWYRLNSSDGAFHGVHWGQNGDRPIPGDYDGDGKADVAVHRPDENNAWYILKSTTGTYDAVTFYSGFPVPAGYLTSPPTPAPGTGLKGDYYNSVTPEGAIAFSRTDSTVNFDWGSDPGAGVSSDNFSVRWTGQVLPLYSETYTFHTVSDDGVRLWVNGTQVINNWTDHPATENSGTITLNAGQRYDIRMEFYERAGGAVARLSWSSPTQTRQIIPASQLYPSAASTFNPPLVLDDFESGTLSGWTTYANPGSSVTASALNPGYASNYAMSVNYNVSEWGGIEQFFNAGRNWSGYTNLDFWFYGSSSGNRFRVEIYDNGNTAGSSERFEYQFVDNLMGWRRMIIPLNSFTRRTDWQPSGAPNDGLTLTQMWGFNFAPLAGSGSFRTDQVQLTR
ncbi:MAG TPA: S8 family serine peptidase [Pyrinomonadaceae bacterium]|nr:S8 family serine peptidase [Pyrinomonadaceae bacterium]